MRKRAIKILWESCIRVPDFPLSTEASLLFGAGCTLSYAALHGAFRKHL